MFKFTITYYKPLGLEGRFEKRKKSIVTDSWQKAIDYWRPILTNPELKIHKMECFSEPLTVL